MTNKRQTFFEVENIINEFKEWLKLGKKVDVITIVGEGEPTLYYELGALIKEMKKLTDIPIAVITNGALLYDEEVRNDLSFADIVLPSLDAVKEEDFVKINRHHGNLSGNNIMEGLKIFSKTYSGQLWIEIMLIKGINDSDENLYRMKEYLAKVKYDRIFINTPVRPPAESNVVEPDKERIDSAMKILGGTAINHLASDGFSSDIKDDYRAILSIIKRHPMNQFEIRSFLQLRENEEPDKIIEQLEKDNTVEVVNYKGYKTYRS